VVRILTALRAELIGWNSGEFQRPGGFNFGFFELVFRREIVGVPQRFIKHSLLSLLTWRIGQLYQIAERGSGGFGDDSGLLPSILDGCGEGAKADRFGIGMFVGDPNIAVARYGGKHREQICLAQLTQGRAKDNIFLRPKADEFEAIAIVLIIGKHGGSSFAANILRVNPDGFQSLTHRLSSILQGQFGIVGDATGFIQPHAENKTIRRCGSSPVTDNGDGGISGGWEL